jgi:hypothetical protein
MTHTELNPTPLLFYVCTQDALWDLPKATDIDNVTFNTGPDDMWDAVVPGETNLETSRPGLPRLSRSRTCW